MQPDLVQNVPDMSKLHEPGDADFQISGVLEIWPLGSEWLFFLPSGAAEEYIFIRFSETPDGRKTVTPNFRNSEFSDFRISGIPDFRNSGIPDFRSSGFLEIWPLGSEWLFFLPSGAAEEYIFVRLSEAGCRRVHFY